MWKRLLTEEATVIKPVKLAKYEVARVGITKQLTDCQGGLV
jgi:hypothetical protein